MKTSAAWIWAVVIIIVLGGVWYYFSHATPPGATPPPVATDEIQVRAVVTDFGTKMKNVSLLAPREDLAAAIAANYGEDVAPALLTSWETNPTLAQNQAPGRMTSSPWPDHIDIQNVVKNNDGSYTVNGTVIEQTSVEAGTTNASDTYSITLIVSNVNGSWLISAVTRGVTTPSP